MDRQNFEVSMAKFLEKANVLLLKKGIDYQDEQFNSSYILLDEKRSSYYLTEIDSEFDDTSLTSAIDQLTSNSSLNNNVAYAILSLGRAYKHYTDNGLILTEKDLTSYNKHTSLIIDNDNTQVVTAYLDECNIKYQTIPNKNNFTILFINPEMSSKFINIYDEYSPSSESITEDDTKDNMDSNSDTLEQITEENTNQDNNITESDNLQDDATQVETNTDTDNIDTVSSDENTINNDNIEVESINEVTQENISSESDSNNAEASQDDELLPDEEEMLDNIDLSDLLKPNEQEEPKDEAESDLLYGKLLKEQAEHMVVSDISPKTKHLEDVPDGIFDEDDLKEVEIIKEHQHQAEEQKKNIKNSDDMTKDSKKQKSNNDSDSGKNFTILSLPGKAMADCVGFLFFFPSYILNKFTKNILPTFATYWIASLFAIFGGYQMIFSFFGLQYAFIYEYANNAIDIMLHYSLPADRQLTTLEQLSVNMVSQGAVMFSGELNIVTFLVNGWLLHFLISVAALMMVIPAFRRIGKTLTIFSILMYFSIPLVVWLQCYLIKMAVTLDALNNVASLLYFSVYIFPVLLVLFVLYISSAIVPDENKHKGVLP